MEVGERLRWGWGSGAKRLVSWEVDAIVCLSGKGERAYDMEVKAGWRGFGGEELRGGM